ncbi:MAG: dockerin type I repeat-containing protein [Clostridia bacterium]|nr:dockerin type I repeat-containing protein [Clostridia bacterium]
MRKRSKVLISLLLLVAMVVPMVPFTAIVAGAAGDGAFHYEVTNEITQYDDYLVVNTANDGTAYALTPAGAGQQQSTTSTSVTIADGKIAGSTSTAALEGKFMKTATADSGNTPETFMLYNPSTGAFIWDPAYEADVWTLGTTTNPVQDTYGGGTIANFNFPSSTGTPTVANSENLLAPLSDSPAYNFKGTIAYDNGGWLTHTALASGDGHVSFNFARTTLPVETWRYAVYTYHRAVSGTAIPTNTTIGFYTSTTTKPDFLSGSNVYNYKLPNNNGGNWRGVAVNLYDNIDNQGWKSGNADKLRIDPNDAGSDANQGVYIASVALAKTERGAQIFAGYTNEISAYRSGGLIPSVEYPFCQFAINLSGNDVILRMYSPVASNPGGGLNGYGYYVAPAASANTPYTISTNSASVKLFKKVYDDTYAWTLVDHIENGGVYALVSSNTNGSAYVYGPNSSSAGTIAPAETTIANGTFDLALTNYMWTAVKVGVDANGNDQYIFNNNKYGGALMDNGSNDICSEKSVDSGGQYGFNYTWRYDSANARLYGSHPAKDCTIAAGTHYYAMSGNDLVRDNSSAKVYLYKRAYHTHTFPATPSRTTPATCTEPGYAYYVCSECGAEVPVQTAPATGHSMTAHAATDPTCTASGNYAYWSCSACGKYFSDAAGNNQIAANSWVRAANGHHFDGAYAGNTNVVHKCTVCGAEEAHTFPADWTQPVNSCTGRYKDCTVCGYRYTDPDAPQVHTLDGGRIVENVEGYPDCEHGGTVIYYCYRCGDPIETRPIPATGHFYDANGVCKLCGDTNGVAETGADVRYDYVDEPIPGQEYVIANTNYQGSAYVAGSMSGNITPASGTAFENEWIYAVPATVEGSGANAHISDAGKATRWNYNSNRTFTNVLNTTEKLWGKLKTAETPEQDDEWIHFNIGSSTTNYGGASVFTDDEVNPATSAGSNNQIITSGVGTQVKTDDGLYLGFKDIISQQGFTVPGKGIVRFSGYHYDENGRHDPNNHSNMNPDHYLPIGGYIDADGDSKFCEDDDINPITGNCVIDFDFAMEAPTTVIQVMRPDYNNGCYGKRIMIFDGYVFVMNNRLNFWYDTGAHQWNIINWQEPLFYGKISDYTHTEFTFGEDAWHHFRLVSKDNTEDGKSVRIAIDGVEICNIPDWAFVLYPEHTDRDDGAIPGGGVMYDKPNQVNTSAPPHGKMTWGGMVDNREVGSSSNYYSYKLFTLFTWAWVNGKNLGLCTYDSSRPYNDRYVSTSEWYALNLPQGTYVNSENYREIYQYGNPGDGNVYVDNISVTSDNGMRVFDDFDGNGNAFYYEQTAQILDNVGAHEVNVGETIAENVFVADADHTNRLFFYEKQYAATVEYYLNGVKQETVKDYLRAGTSFSNETRSYSNAQLVDIKVGGDSVGTSPAIQSATVSTDTDENIIQVYYESIAQYNYTVEYYYEGVKDGNLTFNGPAVNTGTQITFGNATYFPAQPKAHYHLNHVDPALSNGTSGTVTINSANQVIKVYYVLDDVHYTVNYFYEVSGGGSYAQNNAYTYTGDSVKVKWGTYVDYNTTAYPAHKDTGYTENTTDHAVQNRVQITTEGQVINVYYDLIPVAYEIQYYLDEVKDDSMTETGSKKPVTTITYGTNDFPDKTPAGYVLDTIDPGTTVTIQNGVEPIKVYYKQAVKTPAKAFALDYAEIGIDYDYIIDGVEMGNADVSISALCLTERGDTNKITTGRWWIDAVMCDDPVIKGPLSIVLDEAMLYVETTASYFNEKIYIEYTIAQNGETAYIYQEVQLVPATTIYFEDTNSMISYIPNPATSNLWTEVEGDGHILAMYDEVYGASDALNDTANLLYSGGVSHKTVFTSLADASRKATFTFTGTGFDILSHCSDDTGIIFVNYKGADGVMHQFVVNTYMGYAYGEYTHYYIDEDDGSVQSEQIIGWYQTGDEDAVYQVPVMAIRGLPYGTYDVEVIPLYYKDFKGRLEGNTEFYLDGVRIYQPAFTDTDAIAIYGTEAEADYRRLADYVVTGQSTDENNEDTHYARGVLYFRGGDDNAFGLSDQETFGPSNEVYVTADGRSDNPAYVSFNISASAPIDKIFISASAIDGPAKMQVNGHEIVLNAGTDMFYDITDYVQITSNTRRTRPIVITSAQNTVALTYVKVIPMDYYGGFEFELTSDDYEEMVEATLGVIRDGILIGDVNGDGVISAKDSALIKKYLTGDSSLEFTLSLAADVNGDGVVTSRDIKALKALLAA